MADEPLSAEERDEFWEASGWDRGDILDFAGRYEATCRTLEAERDRLRDALTRIETFAGRLDEDDADVIWEIVYHATTPDPPAGT